MLEKRDEGFREVPSRASGRGPRSSAASEGRGPRRRDPAARASRDSK